MCKICGETKHEAKDCWMRHVTLNNEEWTEGNMGSPLQIDLSKVIKSPVHKNEECPICFEKIEERNCATTKCGHQFCLSCIIKSGRISNDCPLCRQAITDRTVVRRLFQVPRLNLEQINRETEELQLPRGRDLFTRLFINRRRY